MRARILGNKSLVLTNVTKRKIWLRRKNSKKYKEKSVLRSRKPNYELRLDPAPDRYYFIKDLKIKRLVAEECEKLVILIFNLFVLIKSKTNFFR